MKEQETNTKKPLGYWIILTNSYEIDGKWFNKGLMEYHTSKRPVMNKDWRRATQEEIDTKSVSKYGNYYNHKID